MKLATLFRLRELLEAEADSMNDLVEDQHKIVMEAERAVGRANTDEELCSARMARAEAEAALAGYRADYLDACAALEDLDNHDWR